jgi:hypothetical protein
LANQASTLYFVIAETDPLIVEHVTNFWRKLCVEVIAVTEYDEIAGFLRQVQWGVPGPGEYPLWLDEALQYIRVNAGMLRTNAWTLTARASAEELQSELKQTFAYSDEKIGVSFFLPVENNEIYLAEVCKVDADGNSPTNSADHAKEHRLSIKAKGEQGMAGVAFTKGLTLEAIGLRATYFDYNFDDHLTETFAPRWWKSLLAIPQLGGALHVPLGVVCITSSHGFQSAPTPFWKRKDIDHDFFLRTVRGVFNDLLRMQH